MIRLIGCFVSLVILSSPGFAQTGSLDLIPSVGEKGKTIDLTIKGTEGVPPELPSVELELSTLGQQQEPLPSMSRSKPGVMIL